MIRTLADVCRIEERVRKSRFLAIAGPVADADGALAFFDRYRDAGATHNCWAYRIGDAYRFSDDGEPGGTAGRPILAAIDGSGLDGVAVLVIRHYGGIKLGAGGLVRAYGGAAGRCLAAGTVRTIIPRLTLVVTLPFDDVGALHGLVERLDAQRLHESWGTESASFEIDIAAPEAEDFTGQLENLTRGNARVRRQDRP